MVICFSNARGTRQRRLKTSFHRPSDGGKTKALSHGTEFGASKCRSFQKHRDRDARPSVSGYSQAAQHPDGGRFPEPLAREKPENGSGMIG